MSITMATDGKSSVRGSSSKSKVMLRRLLLVHVLLLAASGGAAGQPAGLKVGFYARSCPAAKSIVRNITWARTARDGTLAGKMLQLFFHDCFPQGCDASVLLDGPDTEKAAPPNESLGGFGLVDEVKAALERACPGTVSCADVVALAARDAVSLQFGRPLWEVETGRRDILSSRFDDAFHVPNPEFGFEDLRKVFAVRGLSVADLVALSGAHTLGVTNCKFVSPRLYTFKGNGGVDPLIDGGYARQLMQQCPNMAARGIVSLDPGSEFRFDTSYYRTVKTNRGALLTDAALLHDAEAARLVDEMLDQGKFLAAFAASIKKMGAIGVRTGDNGQIRRNCHFKN
ncbi:hypothetical protein ACP4OV_005661 [Aristida adscensionis]